MQILLCGNMPTPFHGFEGGSISQGLLVQKIESVTNQPTTRILCSRIPHSHELSRRAKGRRVSISLEGSILLCHPVQGDFLPILRISGRRPGSGDATVSVPNDVPRQHDNGLLARSDGIQPPQSGPIAVEEPPCWWMPWRIFACSDLGA